MATEVARSIKILKDGDVSIDSYPKNEFPREYKKWKYDHKKGNVYEWLLKQLDSYELQPLDSADNYKWWGIMKFLNDRNLKGERRLEKFKELVDEKTSDKIYYVVLNLQIAGQGIVYGKINKNKLEFTRDFDNATLLPKYTAKYKAQSFPSAEIKKKED